MFLWNNWITFLSLPTKGKSAFFSYWKYLHFLKKMNEFKLGCKVIFFYGWLVGCKKNSYMIDWRLCLSLLGCKAIFYNAWLQRFVLLCLVANQSPSMLSSKAIFFFAWLQRFFLLCLVVNQCSSLLSCKAIFFYSCLESYFLLCLVEKLISSKLGFISLSFFVSSLYLSFYAWFYISFLLCFFHISFLLCLVSRPFFICSFHLIPHLFASMGGFISVFSVLGFHSFFS